MTEALKPCAGCGKPTSGMCWTDCGMSLCGSPLCGDCIHVDEKYGWRHETRAPAALAEHEAATDTTWHERRTMLPDGDARKGGEG